MRLDDRFRWLIWLSLAEIGTMLVFNNYSALLPILQKEWSLTNSEAGWIDGPLDSLPLEEEVRSTGFSRNLEVTS